MIENLLRVWHYWETALRKFFRKSVLKVCSQFTGDYPFYSAISIKLHCIFIEIALWHGCFPGNLMHFFRLIFHQNTFGGLLLFTIVIAALITYPFVPLQTNVPLRHLWKHQKPEVCFRDRQPAIHGRNLAH